MGFLLYDMSEGRYLVDGAIAKPMPVSVLKGMGADFIIAVNTTPGVQERLHEDGTNKKDIKANYIYTYSYIGR